MTRITLGKQGKWKRAFVVCFLCAAAIASHGQTFQTLASFNGNDGAEPAYMSLVQGLDGNLYGTTSAGIIGGTVFEITFQGTLTELYGFCTQQNCTDGYRPLAGLVQGVGGNFYGTTYYGGTSNLNAGTVFRITPSGSLATLHSFCVQFGCSDGGAPSGRLFQGVSGTLYGTTDTTIFSITPDGTFATLYTFCTQPGCSDGSNVIAGLVHGKDGNFYGTTEGGGAYQFGTIFKFAPGDILTTLHSFNVSDGANPYAGLIQAANGSFYGTTYAGGLYGGGTIFKITPGGTLTRIYNFCAAAGCLDGAGPTAGLIQATDRNFYGTTLAGGTNGGHGTVFKITPSGVLTTLHSFNSTDGANPEGGLVQATDGNFYGTTASGGTNNNGTVFSVSAGLRPFVESLPAFGHAGASVRIFGTNLTGATSVTFNGTPATFTVFSPTLLKTTVPTGATTGKVQVTTPSGTLTSNVVFRVK